MRKLLKIQIFLLIVGDLVLIAILVVMLLTLMGLEIHESRSPVTTSPSDTSLEEAKA